MPVFRRVDAAQGSTVKRQDEGTQQLSAEAGHYTPAPSCQRLEKWPIHIQDIGSVFKD